MSQLSQSLREIDGRLEEVRRSLLKTDLASRSFRWLALMLIIWVAALLLESIFFFPPFGRTVLVTAAFALSAILLLLLLGRLLMALVGLIELYSDASIARRIGKHFPQVQDRLVNLLQLRDELHSPRSPYSADLIEASLGDLIRILAPLSFLDAVDRTGVRSQMKRLVWTAGGAVVLGIFFPASFEDAAYRLYRFSEPFVPPPQYVFSVYPGDHELIKGEDARVAVRVQSRVSAETGQAVPLPALLWKTEGQIDYSQTPFQRLSADSFRITLGSVRQTTTYLVTLGNETSDAYTLTVLDRPLIKSLRVRIQYPSYTGLSSRLQDEFAGDVAALPGSRIRLTGSSDKDLLSATLVFQNKPARPMQTQGTFFSSDFELREEDSYHVELVDADSLSNANPIMYRLSIIPDQSPIVELLQPGRDIDIAGDGFVPLRIRISDDYGFSRLQLGYRLSHSRYETVSDAYTTLPLPLPSGAGSTDEVVPYSWDLHSLALVPEDVVEYYAEVFDNDVINGPKGARTPFYRLRLPSLEEVFTDLDEGHQQSLQEMKESLQQADELKRDVESIADDIRQNKDLDWQQEKKLETLAEQYRQVQRALEEVQTRLDTLVQQMQQQRVLSNETLEKYLELQQLFEELNSTELQQALSMMQDALQKVNRSQLQEALSKLQFSEERFRSSIERTMNLLKRIQVELKLDELRARAEEIEGLQQDIGQEAAHPDSARPSELARRQDQLASKQEDLEAAAKELQKNMEEFYAEMPAERMQALNDSLAAFQLPERMQEASRQLLDRQYPAASRSQQQMQQSLSSVSRQIQSIQKEMLQQQTQQVLRQLQKSAQDLLELSQRQETIRDQTRGAPGNSPQLRQSAQDQASVMRDLSSVIKELSKLSNKSFAVSPGMGRAIGEALGHMERSARSLDVRNGTGAANEQTSAMGALNEASVLVQEATRAVQQQGPGGMGGLLQQLQSLASEQASINAQTKSMREAAEAARLAAGQAAVQKSLEQLQQEAQQRGELDRILGDLGDIGTQMKEVVRDLEQRNVSPETVRRQEQILSRLLDASRSMREQDFERRRRAQTGVEVVRQSPGALNPLLLRRADRLRRELLNSLEWGYSRDYEVLIREYFETLRQLDVQSE